jgi:hypothetical protein
MYISVPVHIAEAIDGAVYELQVTLGYTDMMMFYLFKNYNEKVSQNLYSIRFHTDQPERHEYKGIIYQNE